MNVIYPRLILAFILALALTILPMPELLNGIRPSWVLLLVLYLQFYLPDYFQVWALFVVGLILDVLLSTVIGEHAFALTVTAWLINSKSRRFYFFSIGQQMALIGLFSAIYQGLLMIITASLGFHTGWIGFVGSVVSSVILWPWVRLVLEDTLLKSAVRRRSQRTTS